MDWGVVEVSYGTFVGFYGKVVDKRNAKVFVQGAVGDIKGGIHDLSQDKSDLVSSSLSSSLYLLFTFYLLSRVCGFQVSLRSMYKPQVSYNVRNREGNVVEEYWKARGS